MRARIVLACAEGRSVTAVAADLEVTRDTVRKWRSRFLEDRLDGLGDAPRPGAPRTITNEQVELVIARTLAEHGPGQGTHWSTRSGVFRTYTVYAVCGGEAVLPRLWTRACHVIM